MYGMQSRAREGGAEVPSPPYAYTSDRENEYGRELYADQRRRERRAAGEREGEEGQKMWTSSGGCVCACVSREIRTRTRRGAHVGALENCKRTARRSLPEVRCVLLANNANVLFACVLSWRFGMMFGDSSEYNYTVIGALCFGDGARAHEDRLETLGLYESKTRLLLPEFLSEFCFFVTALAITLVHLLRTKLPPVPLASYWFVSLVTLSFFSLVKTDDGRRIRTIGRLCPGQICWGVRWWSGGDSEAGRCF